MIQQLIWVALGGAMGAICRASIAMWLPVIPGKWPIATFMANVLGCLLMGIAFYFLNRLSLPIVYKSIVMTGFLGALTTFSSFALEAWLMFQHNAPVLALTYVAASALTCFLAVAAGHYLAATVYP